MLKIKFYFKLWLLAALFFLNQTGVFAKDLDFSSLSSCKSDTQQYVINYDNVGELEWIVEGGIIISLDGRDNSMSSQRMFETYMGTQWYTVGSHNVPFNAYDTYSYTRIKFDGNRRMEATCYISTASGPRLFDGSDHATHAPTLSNNPLKKITVVWFGAAIKRTITCKGDGLGAVGFLTGESGEVQKTIQVYKPVPNITLNSYNPNLICTQGILLDGVPYDNAYYTNAWNAPGGVISNNWNSGIFIDHFTNSGIVPVTITISNVCGESSTKQINLNVSQPEYGHIIQGINNVDVPGSLVTLDCQGSFNLNMPLWISNKAIYTWELPGAEYNSQTNTYTKTIVTGINKQNVQGQLPIEGLTDFVGKVTITGVCGAPVVKNFIIRPALRPTVDPEIYSCTNSVSIKVNNPTGYTNVNAWVAYSTPLNLQASITNQTSTSFQFTSARPGTYYVTIGVNGADGCYTRLGTVVYTGTAGQTPTTNTTGWQAGVLSDNRKAPGSNIIAYGGNIYFSGRDGKIYYYSFSAASQKWIINEIPGITNALVPASGAFTKIGLATLSGVSYLYYTDNVTGKLWKIDLATNLVNDAFTSSINASDFITFGNDVYAIQKGTNVLILNGASTSFTLPNTTLKAVIPGYGLMYVQNNNLFSTNLGQLTFGGDVYSGSDVVYYNGWVYYTRGQKGSANLYRMQMPNPFVAEQITTSSNLSGIFNINPTSGVIYYGVMNLGAANTVLTPSSGSYKDADIYQARLSGTTWVLNKATTIVSNEGADMLIHSAVYSGNHLYYVGAGHNASVSLPELEIWNLYYENGCAPAIQRTAVLTGDEEISPELLVYPNPFNAELLIDLSMYSKDGDLTHVDIEVLDAAGKTIYEGIVSSELVNLSTTEWAKGMYIVKIKHNNTVINKKAIKY